MRLLNYHCESVNFQVSTNNYPWQGIVERCSGRKIIRLLKLHFYNRPTLKKSTAAGPYQRRLFGGGA